MLVKRCKGSNMNELTAQVLKDAVQYTQTVQPFIDKQAQCNHMAETTVDSLILNGVVPFEKRAELIEDLSDPTRAYSWLKKLASTIGPDDFAYASDEPDFSAGSAEDRFMNWIMS